MVQDSKSYQTMMEEFVGRANAIESRGGSTQIYGVELARSQIEDHLSTQQTDNFLAYLNADIDEDDLPLVSFPMMDAEYIAILSKLTCRLPMSFKTG